MQNKRIIIVGVLFGLLLILVLPRFLGNDEETETVEVPVAGQEEEEITPPLRSVERTPVTTEPEAAPEPATEVEALREEVTVVEPEPVELPPLNDSDPFVVEQVNTLPNSSDLLQQMASGQSIRKFVVLVDNMSRGDVPPRDLPVLGPRTEIEVIEQGENLYEMQTSSYDRFDEMVESFTAVSPEQAAAMLTLFMPLFDQAYAELGYRDRRFADVLNEAFEAVANAPEVEGEILLVRPSVFYEFEDPELENLSNVEKLLIRMGPENARKVKAKVAEIREVFGND